jgi:hypothetical protein
MMNIARYARKGEDKGRNVTHPVLITGETLESFDTLRFEHLN